MLTVQSDDSHTLETHRAPSHMHPAYAATVRARAAYLLDLTPSWLPLALRVVRARTLAQRRVDGHSRHCSACAAMWCDVRDLLPSLAVLRG